MYDVVGSGDGFITIIFVIVFIIIIVNVFKSLGQWKKNEESPRLSVPAHVKIKRTNVTRNSHLPDNNVHSHSSSTTYYITFEFESGDRSEFQISGKEFGLLAEGDFGTLTFKGTRYIDFIRELQTGS